MKKFISMVMAAAMVVSLVPATAFAANTAAFKVVGSEKVKEADATAFTGTAGLTANGTEAQVQIIIQDVDTVAKTADTFEFDLEFDNIELKANNTTDAWVDFGGKSGVYRGFDNDVDATAAVVGKLQYKAEWEKEDTTMSFKVIETKADFKAGDVIVIPLTDVLVMSDDNEGTVGTVTVTGDFGESEAMPVVSVVGQALDVTVSGKPVEVAEEELAALKKITIESVAGDFESTDKIKVKIDKGFEFVNVNGTKTIGTDRYVFSAPVRATDVEEDEFVLTGISGTDTIVITGLVVEAVDAKAGDIASIVVSCRDYEGDSDEAAEVIADAVIMSVDEDEDVPVMYSGTNRSETGLTSGESHKALKVTIEESVAGAWDTVKGFELRLPEGVYVTDVDQRNLVNNTNGAVVWDTFAEAYKDGDYKFFDFGRRTFDFDDNKKGELTFRLELVAEPEFEGPVTLTLTGDAFEEAQEVVIAEFVKAYTVEAAQNDLVIDYKETVVPTSVVITEAEEGLWNDSTEFKLAVEDIRVEDSEITVNEDDSDMEISERATSFKVTKESDDEVGVVTLDNVELYMSREIPAGAYDLNLVTTMGTNFMAETVFGITDTTDKGNWNANQIGYVYYDDDAEYVETVKEGWINVITAGRDKDDASFTKKVVVPVGAMEIVAGEEVVTLDVPAYINAAGYTMLPVRAVSVALGIHNNNVIWDQATKTVTILYGQRIITMQVGSKVINVNGSAIPASAAVEIVDGRTFLGLRDLATALGVVDITWDAATQTATLNGNK